MSCVALRSAAPLPPPGGAPSHRAGGRAPLPEDGPPAGARRRRSPPRPWASPTRWSRPCTATPARSAGDLAIELVDGSYEGFGPGALAPGDAPTLTGPGGSAALAGYRIRGGDGRPGRAAPRRRRGPPRAARRPPPRAPRPGDPWHRGEARRPADHRRPGGPDWATRTLTGIAIGVLELVGQLGDPQGGDLAVAGVGGSCTTPDFALPVDIALIAIGSVQQSALVSGQVAITPSAELQNVGLADVRWEPVLDPDHPLLHWALYRLDGDRFEQIGLSAVKHAFFAVNSDCPCPGGQVLWALGCTDIYGVSTNEDRSFLGPAGRDHRQHRGLGGVQLPLRPQLRRQPRPARSPPTSSSGACTWRRSSSRPPARATSWRPGTSSRATSTSTTAWGGARSPRPSAAPSGPSPSTPPSQRARPSTPS